VPKVHEVLQTADTVYVAMDQVKGCELFEMMSDGALEERCARRLIAQLLSALASLHKQRVVHRDIKPENLMVSDVDDPRNCRLVLIDFGYAAIGQKDGEPLDGLAGSPEYAAPEVLSWLEGDGTPYAKSCDMWSVGVTAYVLLSGEQPYEFPEEGDLQEHVSTAQINFSQPCWNLPEGEEGQKEMAAAQDFIRACMRVDANARLTAKQGLSHKWFAPRPDDGQFVAIGASIAAIAALQRRVPTVAMSTAPKRVMRWFGRLTSRQLPPSPTKQQFWELKLGMPPMPSEQDASDRQEGESSDAPMLVLPPQPNVPAVVPLVMRPLAALNADVPPAVASGRKSVALEHDRAEELQIRLAATPRAGSENTTEPLPSPRRALFLAPSPRVYSEPAPPRHVATAPPATMMEA